MRKFVSVRAFLCFSHISETRIPYVCCCYYSLADRELCNKVRLTHSENSEMFVKQEKSISEGHVTIYACASIAVTFTQYTARTSRTKSVRLRFYTFSTTYTNTYKYTLTHTTPKALALWHSDWTCRSRVRTNQV